MISINPLSKAENQRNSNNDNIFSKQYNISNFFLI